MRQSRLQHDACFAKHAKHKFLLNRHDGIHHPTELVDMPLHGRFWIQLKRMRQRMIWGVGLKGSTASNIVGYRVLHLPTIAGYTEQPCWALGHI